MRVGMRATLEGPVFNGEGGGKHLINFHLRLWGIIQGHHKGQKPSSDIHFQEHLEHKRPIRCMKGFLVVC